MSLGAKLKEAKSKKTEPPVWEGPESPEAQGGVTQSLLGDYLACGERFRIHTVEGLKLAEGFNKYLEFGNLWHLAEECFGRGEDWRVALRKYAVDLVAKYPMSADDVNKWYNVVLVQFPVYVQFWENHKEQKTKINLMSEVSFRVPYVLPSGRVVYLRGKWDSIDLVGNKKEQGIWLTDHKTKGEIDPVTLEKQLTFDLQTMTYLVALKTLIGYAKDGCPDTVDYAADVIYPSGDYFGNLPIDFEKHQLKGFYYNVIRRPLSGGKGSIRQHQPTKSNPQGETQAEFYARLGGIIEESAAEFFYRWTVEITPAEIEQFEKTFLQPCLENLCDDYEWWNVCKTQGIDVYDYLYREDKFNHQRRHFRLPYGGWNTVLDGGMSDVDEYLNTGVTTGLQRVESLFKELA